MRRGKDNACHSIGYPDRGIPQSDSAGALLKIESLNCIALSARPVASGRRCGTRLAPACLENSAALAVQQKSPAPRAGLFFLDYGRSVRSRRELGHQALDRLEGLLGEVAVEAGDLLRVGDERLIGGTRVVALRFQRLVERLHARELLGERLGLFELLLDVLAIGIGDRRDTALERGGIGDGLLELLLAVALHVF